MADIWGLSLKGYRKVRTFYHVKFYVGEIFHPIYGIVGLKKRTMRAQEAKDWAKRVAEKMNSIQDDMDDKFSVSYLATLSAIEELESQGKELDNEVIKQIAIETDQKLAELLIGPKEDVKEEGAENGHSG